MIGKEIERLKEIRQGLLDIKNGRVDSEMTLETFSNIEDYFSLSEDDKSKADKYVDSLLRKFNNTVELIISDKCTDTDKEKLIKGIIGEEDKNNFIDEESKSALDKFMNSIKNRMYDPDFPEQLQMKLFEYNRLSESLKEVKNVLGIVDKKDMVRTRIDETKGGGMANLIIILELCFIAGFIAIFLNL